jgi:predicted membrane chloride channel (bestrophin family)
MSPFTIAKSATFRRLLFPDLFVVLATSSAVTYWNVLCVDASSTVAKVAGNTIDLHDSMITLPAMPFTLSAVALGLLVTFRTQAGHARYVDARKDWGSIINVTRDLASRCLTRYTRSADKLYAVRLTQTFAIALKYHLTEDGWLSDTACNKGSTAAELEQRKSARMRQELQAVVWSEQGRNLENERSRRFIGALMAHNVANRPLFVLHALSRLNASLANETDAVASVGIDDRILDLTNALGSCERILRTPIYTSYTRHTSRFLTMWCNALPMALYPVVGPALTIPFSLVMSFVMFGIEDIGCRIEEPFASLPLWQYCETVTNSTNQLMRQSLNKETEQQ